MNSEEFTISNSNSYNSRLKYEYSINAHFIKKRENDEILISQNAGYGGLNETFALLKIMNDGSINIKYKTGDLKFNWTYHALLFISLASSLLMLISTYFFILTIALLGLSYLLRSSNNKSARIISDKVNRALIQTDIKN